MFATARALPLVWPVDYVFGDDGAGDVVIANSDGELSAAGADNVVAFEIDDVMSGQATAWNIVVIGLAQKLTC